MKIHPAEQGTRAWHDARARIITASNLSRILTPAKLELSAQSESFARACACARVWGEYEQGMVTYAMQRGTELEPEAVLEYEERTGRECLRVGLCLTDDGTFGASPDALVDDDGGLEIKCPGLDKHLENLLSTVIPSEYVLQVQGCLYATGRDWWDWMSFYPGLPAKVIRVVPDARIQNAIEEAVEAFERKVTGYEVIFGKMKEAIDILGDAMKRAQDGSGR